jgi:hypothetical protein
MLIGQVLDDQPPDHIGHPRKDLRELRPAARTRVGGIASWANRITGTRPANDTTFSASNAVFVRAALCNNRIYEVPSRFGLLEASVTPIVPGQRALPLSRHDQLPRFIGRVEDWPVA